MTMTVSANACVTCGACCASYRVSFYWAEGDDAPAGIVPHQLTEKLNDFRRCMQGTNSATPRCVALQGDVGQAVSCAIYENRPTPCRDFDISWQGSNDACDRARAKYGLAPLINIVQVA